MAPTIEARVVPVGSKNLSRLSHTLGGSWTESLTSLCPLFPYLHVLPFFLIFCFVISVTPRRRSRDYGQMERVEFDSPGWGRSRAQTILSQEAQVRSASQFWVGVVVLYSFVERDRSSHFGFVPTSLRPLRTSVPQPVSKLRCRTKAPSPNIPKNQKKAAEWNPQNRPGDLATPSSNQLVVVWLQQLKPGWCQFFEKICRGCPVLWGVLDRVPDLAVSPVSISSRASFFSYFSALQSPSLPVDARGATDRWNVSSLIPPVGVGAAPKQSCHKKLKCDRPVRFGRGCSLLFR